MEERDERERERERWDREGGSGECEAERNERKFRHIITPTRPRMVGPCGWRLNTSSGVRANVRYIGRPAAQGLSA